MSTQTIDAIFTRTERERCLDAFPAGSNGEFNFPPELAIVVERGKGPHLWDTDANQYLDMSMGWGSVLVGHANERVIKAATTQATLGSNFACVNRRSLELAERIIAISPACDRVRFCASGTEATNYCARIARAATAKTKILKFEGAYHGANDIGVTSLFPSKLNDFPNAERSCQGVTQNAADQILVAPFNDLESTAAIIREHHNEIAAIIVEPFHRCIAPVDGFLPGLRRLCDQHAVILIFDEVVTGFRLAFGGAQQYYAVTPDLVAYGKALGGGFPIGLFGGKHELMQIVEEHRMNNEPYVWTASTLGGNPISCAAAWAALDHLEQPGTYTHLHELGTYLRKGLRRVMNEQGVTGQVIGDGPLAQFIFSSEPVHDYRSTRAGDRQKARRILLALIQRGIFLNPMGTKLYLSTEHTEDDCDTFLNAFQEALQTDAAPTSHR
ncbi:MAG: aspartate aminotransferase family protein [Phycisphaerales bacterium JB052]